ncbi:IS5 family transposase [Cohaesibacter sp. CAU 1516]|uniref:IS5 family transposase n=1 Tax=Cohaesibacter sp. CAU 1516 TaxID=2576038 RepID=UPI0010FED5D9|nr:IS5 family transposase [Cohaesibacter sp. CAU 1516]TLP42304.1 IS5 family transposase [Cohaesibacter sp. CAU 1516]
MGHLFWLSDAQWAVIEPLLPNNKGGARRVDDRRVISGIIHVLKVGCRWCDCPEDYGPSTTIYNRFNRWSHKRFWVDLVEALATSGAVTKSTAIDSTYVKAHRSAHGGKGGPKNQAIGPSRGGQTTKIHVLTDVIGRPFAFKLTGGNAADSPIAPVLLNSLKGARYLLADKGYDANCLRKHLRQSAIVPVIPGRSNRKRSIRYDERRYKDRHLIENAFCRLKDFRRVATRYDKLARNFLSAVALATLIAFWV